MDTKFHKARTRGHFNYGWLDTKHSFSFANYFDPEKMNFGVLRVLNDDVVEPGKGFDKHPHSNMEIITIPISGKIKHRDSMGNEQFLNENDVQVMSAGTGIFHEEYNGSSNDDVNFLQIWIFPDKKNIKPVYNQKYYDPGLAINKWQILVSKNNKDSLIINQNATISRIFLKKGKEISYKRTPGALGSYLFVINGTVSVVGETLEERDALEIANYDIFVLNSKSDSYILNIEVPDVDNK